MLYLKHNYPQNFLNANGSSDAESAKDIMLNRLIDAILLKKDEFIKALNDSGIRTSATANSRTVVRSVIDNLKKKEFVARLDKIIGPVPGSSANGKFSNFLGIDDAISGVASAVSGYLSSGNNLDSEKEKTKQAELQLQAAQILAAKSGEKTGLSTGAWVGIGLGATAFVSLLIYVIAKK